MNQKIFVPSAAVLALLSGCSIPPSHAEPILVNDTMPTTHLIHDWSMQFTREDLMDQAISKAHDYFELKRQQPHSKINYFFEDSVGNDRREKVKDLSEITMSVFGEYVYQEQNVVAGTTQDFMTNTVIENQLEIPQQIYEGTSSLCAMDMWEDLPSGCNWDNSSWLGFGEVPYETAHALDNVTPHELFHSAQSNLANGTFNLNFVPVWMVEGSAEFMGYAIADYAGYFSYEDLAHEDWHYLPNPATGLSFWSSPPGGGTVPPEWYTLGQIATEYIIVNTDVESLMLIFKYVGDGMQFHEAFEKAIGIDLIKFYIIFDIAYANMLDADTGNFKTFENRICPEEFGWNCEIDNYRNLEWWQLYPVSVPLPEVAENSNHGEPIDKHKITPQVDSCNELKNFGRHFPLAVSFEALDKSGISAHVSTEWYVKQAALDTNLDGIICGPGDSL